MVAIGMSHMVLNFLVSVPRFTVVNCTKSGLWGLLQGP